jgi:hypothetical protein
MTEHGCGGSFVRNINSNSQVGLEGADEKLCEIDLVYMLFSKSYNVDMQALILGILPRNEQYKLPEEKAEEMPDAGQHIRMPFPRLGCVYFPDKDFLGHQRSKSWIKWVAREKQVRTVTIF